MNGNSYTLFTFNNLVYGIKTIFIEEMFFLPELTAIPEVPSDIVGGVNIRGKMIPIMDLNHRFGYQSSTDYLLSDNVIILQWETLKVGIIVNTIEQVIEISSEKITTELSYDTSVDRNQEEKFIEGIATLDHQIIFLLNPEKILHYIDLQNIDEHLDSENLLETRPSIFCPNATLYQREIFEQRATKLKKNIRDKKLKNSQSIAIIKLHEQLLGINLNWVREFTNLEKVTPIPCTPQPIIGNMNWRGEILTLIDLSRWLNLPHQELTPQTQVMIVEIEEIRVGIVINEIKDIILLDSRKILSQSTKLREINEAYIQGIVHHLGTILVIVDLVALLSQEQLILDEAV